VEVTRFLGTQRYAWLMDLGGGPGCSFQLLRREHDGARFLAQLWSPLPADRDLDQLRDTFLARFLDAVPLDPVLGHFGFDDGQAWHLQALQGTPLSRLWPGWDAAQRQALLQHLDRELERDPHPRFLHPEAITFRPGLTQVPRALGEAPWGLPGLTSLLPAGLPASSSGDLPWTHPRDLSEPLARPVRGRTQELPYLKSLMLGLDAPIPMERIVLLQGEEGIGKAHLAAWARAVAEGEGIWTHQLEASTEESAGRFLGRLLEALLAGREADLYAQRPEAARALSLRVQAYAFLTGGRHRNRQEAGPEPEEVKAALEALDFARLLHPRLIHLSDLERATPEVLALVRELVHRSELPWLLSLTTGAQGAGLKPLIADLRQEAAAALVGVNRLEDDDLRTLLDDLLGRHALPEGYVDGLVTQSLGNPGLLLNVLELAQQEGVLAWEQDRWTLAGRPETLRAEADLVQQVFLGRLQRLTPAAATLVRLLALAERPLPDGSLGRLLGLSGEALEDALQGASGSRLIQLQAHQASIPDPRWRELVLSHTPQAELKRLARALLAILQEQGGPLAPPVTLQALATDEATALAAVLEVLDHQAPAPQEAQRMVEQALQLQPRPWDEARLHEHLADAWAAGSQAPLAEGELPAQSVADRALEALDRALDALGRATFHEGIRLAEARILRKRAMLLLQLRRPAEAQEPVMAAAERLKDHPLHPEQPRLRLALGQLHLLQGHLTKGIRALEEGLHPQGPQNPGGRPQGRDQAALLTALGRALAAQGQFQRAADLLESAQRLLEHGQDFRGQVPAQIALAQVRLAQGQAGPCIALLQEALQTARMQGDLGLQCQSHLALGTVRSLQQFLGPAMTHLDRALGQAKRLGDAAQVSMIQVWRARTFAAMGDPVAADHAQFQAAGPSRPLLAPEEQGEHTMLQGEVARFRGAWRDAARLLKAAADQFEASGTLWCHRLARLRLAQALARESQRARQEAPEQGWAILETLKGPVEGSGSRWLDLEWHRAHALLLSTVPPTEAVAEEALHAWSEVLAAGRDLQFPAQVVEACTEGAQLLLQRGEKLGAKARLQDAFPSFQELWSHLPESQGTAFLGREDLHRFRQTVEAAGLRWVLPDRADPLQDWTPTQMNLPVVPEAE
jgi:tetratricopeptide (TPR) repeat protein